MIILGSIFILIISAMLFKYASGSLSLTKPHLISIIFYKDFILYAFIGVVLISISFDLSNNIYFWGISGHIHSEARFYGWLSTMYTMIAFPIGMIIANFIILKKLSIKKEIQDYYNKPIVPLISLKETHIFYSIIIFLTISFLSILYTFLVMKNFPIIHLLSGTDSVTLAQMRANAKIHFSGIAAIRDVLSINMTFFLSLVCYAYMLLYKKGKFKVLFYISSVLTFLALTYNLEKAPFFWYLISLFFIKIIYKNGISFKKALIFFIPLILIIFIVYKVITGFDNFGEAFLYRIFIAQSVAIFQGFEYFPAINDFLGFSGISNLYSKIFGDGTVYNSGRVLFEIYSPSAIENNTAGLIVGLFNAEAWMLFGLAGVIFLPIYVGIFVQIINIYFLKSRKTPIFIALYIYLWTKLALSGSVAQFIYPIMIFTIFVIFSSLIFVAKILNQKYNGRKF